MITMNHYRDISGWGRSKRLHVRKIEDGLSVRLCLRGPAVEATEPGMPDQAILRGLDEHRSVSVCPVCEARFRTRIEEGEES